MKLHKTDLIILSNLWPIINLFYHFNLYMGYQREKKHLKCSSFAASVTRNHSYFSVCSSFYLSNFLTCFIFIHLFASLFRFWSVIFLHFFWSSFLLVLFSPLLPFLSFLFLLKKPSAVSIVYSKREGSAGDSFAGNKRRCQEKVDTAALFTVA